MKYDQFIVKISCIEVVKLSEIPVIPFPDPAKLRSTLICFSDTNKSAFYSQTSLKFDQKTHIKFTFFIFDHGTIRS